MKCKKTWENTLRKALMLVMIFSLINTIPLSSQNQRLTLNLKNSPISDVFRKIKSETNLSVVYNDDDIASDKIINFEAKDKPLSEVLDYVLSEIGNNLSYVIQDDHIVITSVSAKAAATKSVQQARSISGVITDSEGEPVIGATVVLKNNPSVGTATDFDGKYTLNNVPDNATLIVSYVGMRSQEVVAVPGKNIFNITLSDDSELLDELVVTALGIKRSEKALSYNVQQINADDVIGNKDANFVNSLSGKVAGLNINSSSSGIGGASKVVMRGAKSIEQSSNALYVIDGVPMYSFGKSGGTEFDSQGATEAIADINPEDIESISVLTGAAAAALYGSDAANGAIVVTTKSGQSGKTSITVTSNIEFMDPFMMPKFQNRYGTSEGYKSWGRLLNESNYMGYDPAKDYFQRGTMATESVSLSTGTDKNQTYISGSAVNSMGIIPNNEYNRYNLTFRNTTSFFNDKVKLDLGASYIKQDDVNMTNQGVYMNPLTSAYLFPRGNDWEDIRMYERYDTSRKISEQYWPSGAATYVMQNPYWINYRNLRENNKDRYMINAGLTYQVLDWLSLSTRFRMDNSNNDFTEKLYATTNTLLTEGSPNGLYGISRFVDKQSYGDFLVNINKDFDSQITFNFNGGVSFSDLRSDMFKNRGPIAYGLEIADGVKEPVGIPNVFNVFQLSDSQTLREQAGWREKTNAMFGSAEIGYKNAYYLTLTGRNDWPSQLAGPKSVNKSFFYPSAGLSVVLSEVLSMPKEISYMKLRGSWASVGLPFARFLANPTYKWDASNKVWVTETNYPMYNLKPERTDSWEVGFTTRFLKGFNLDLTYYYANTYNQTFNPQLSASSGYSDIYIQTGSVRNQGLEAALGYKNTWNKFSWNTNYTFSFNRNKIIDLGDNAVNPITGEAISIDRLDVGGLGQAHFILKKNGGLGDLYSMSQIVRDSNGNIYVDENGDIHADKINNADDYIKLGSVFPKSNMAWRNDFSYGNFNLGFMLSARFGGIVFSRTQAAMDYYGVSQSTADARDNGGVIINDGDKIPADVWYGVVANGDAVAQYYTYSATNIRLQEASIGYTVPRKWLGDVVDATVSVVGRNLLMIYSKAPFDPESVASTGNYYQGIDYFMTPNTRNVGVSLRLKF